MNEQFKATTILIAYAASLGVFYLQGFWSIFNINIFQYGDLSDALKATIFPLSGGVITAILAFLTFIGVYLGPELKPRFVDPESRSGRIIVRAVRHRFIAIFVYTFVTLLAFVLLPNQARWFVLGMMATPLGILISNRGPMTIYISNHRLRTGIYMALVQAPFFFASIGAIEAEAITKGQGRYSVDLSKTGTLAPKDSAKKLAYVAFVGGTFFLYDEASKSLVLLKQSDSQPIYLLNNK